MSSSSSRLAEKAFERGRAVDAAEGFLRWVGANLSAADQFAARCSGSYATCEQTTVCSAPSGDGERWEYVVVCLDQLEERSACLRLESLPRASQSTRSVASTR